MVSIMASTMSASTDWGHLAQLDPRGLVQLRTPQSPSPSARAIYKGKIRKQVLNCANCELHRSQPEDARPVPFSSGKLPMFAVLGEAPGPDESRKGEPFIGPSGRLLRALMSDVGIRASTEVLFTNTVSCFPNIEGAIRPPTESERAFCRGNMFDQIEAGYTNFVLLVGGKALNAFRSDLTVTHHHGRVFIWNELYVVMAIPHPAAVLRGQKQFKQIIKQDLEKWADVVYGDDDPLVHLSRACVKCEGMEEFYAWDRDGVPYCKRHWEQWGRQWEKERRRWLGAKTEQLKVF